MRQKLRPFMKGCLVLFVSVLLLLCVVPFAIRFVRPVRAEMICANLLEAGLLEREADCIRSHDPNEYLPGMFPIGRAGVAYVRIGMEGFEIISTASSARCEDGRMLTVIDYKLGTVDEVDFAFCGDELVNIRYSD